MRVGEHRPQLAETSIVAVPQRPVAHADGSMFARTAARERVTFGWTDDLGARLQRVACIASGVVS